jgi:hypothetical protein
VPNETLATQILQPIAVWTNPIGRAQILCKRAATGDPQVEENIFSVDLPAQPSRDQNDVYVKMGMLRRATSHINSATLNQILTNMEILAFGISWFGLVRSVIQ